MKASGGSYHYYQVAADSTTLIASAALGTALSASTTYYWSVQAQGDGGSTTSDSSWPSDYSFTTSASAQGSGCNAVTSGPWTIGSQQSYTCAPYADGTFSARLPIDVMDHLWAGNGGHTGDEVAAYAVTSYGYSGSDNYGIAKWSTTDGYSDQGEPPVYYGQSSDPIYYVNSCVSCTAEGATSPLHTFWHIPNQAKYSGLLPSGTTGTPDNHMVVWDQTNNKVLKLYASGLNITTGALPNCTATTEAQAIANCSLNLSRAQVSDYSTSNSYLNPFSGGNSLFSSGMASIIRTQEMLNGVIPHALYLYTSCYNIDVSPNYVFPAANGWMANDHDSRCPSPGQLFFVDYTDAQIAAMDVSTPQKLILTALAHYGGYFGDGTATGNPMGIGHFEGGRAYELAGGENAIYDWLASEGITPWGGSPPESSERYVIYPLSGIPNLVGPNCSESTCGVLSHVHIADECVALGRAGLEGGCGTPYGAPPSITITSPTYSATYATDSDTLSIGGTAAAVSPATVSSVDCVNDRGGEISMSGTTTWTGSGTYSSGANIITCTVTDSDSEENTDSLTVSYYILSSVDSGTPGQTTATITWTSNIAGNSIVYYGETTDYGLQASDSESVTSHSVGLSGLSASTTYHYKVCTAGFCSSDDTFSTDSGDLTPVLSDVKISVRGFYGVTIKWTTDLASDSYVNYGITTAYGSSAGQADSVTSHSVTISGLSYGTEYHFKLSSSYEGNVGLTDDSTFTTATAGRRLGRIR